MNIQRAHQSGESAAAANSTFLEGHKHARPGVCLERWQSDSKRDEARSPLQTPPPMTLLIIRQQFTRHKGCYDNKYKLPIIYCHSPALSGRNPVLDDLQASGQPDRQANYEK